MSGARRAVLDPGSALAATNFALSAGFGASASVAVAAGSTDKGGEITITSAGAGTGANPTCTLTFKDGVYGAIPVVLACRSGGSQREIPIEVTTVAVGSVLFTLIGTASAAETYKVRWAVLDQV